MRAEKPGAALLTGLALGLIAALTMGQSKPLSTSGGLASIPSYLNPNGVDAGYGMFSQSLQSKFSQTGAVDAGAVVCTNAGCSDVKATTASVGILLVASVDAGLVQSTGVASTGTVQGNKIGFGTGFPTISGTNAHALQVDGTGGFFFLGNQDSSGTRTGVLSTGAGMDIKTSSNKSAPDDPAIMIVGHHSGATAVGLNTVIIGSGNFASNPGNPTEMMHLTDFCFNIDSQKVCRTGISASGRIDYEFKDDSATAGNRTRNETSGRNTIAAGAAAVTITNARADVNSSLIPVLNRQDTTCTTLAYTVVDGGFTVTANANCTADTTFSWLLYNHTWADGGTGG